ncbi:uncharacterized protein LOC129940246 [Eupeodes corollae]|uniref:uncharacterized protein LOC129940246 n=1 Tax=Eupeodes corollae TaxID=290404 RepID=UPI00249015A3|nr:uncharacterized protein LOC129940246 [Eupeodes corollae]
MNKENNSPTLSNIRSNDENNEAISSSPNSTIKRTSRRSFRPTSSYSADFENYIRQEFTALRANIEQLNNSFCELNARFKQLSNNEVINTREISTAFPIETVEDVEELEKKIAEEPDRYIELFKKLVGGNGGIEKNLKNLIGPNVAVLYNFDGTSGKKHFKALKNINTTLYSAVKKDVPSYKLYEKSIRLSFKRIKNLYFKKASNQKKKSPQEEQLSKNITTQEDPNEMYMRTASF